MGTNSHFSCPAALTLLAALSSVVSLDIQRCRQPLGMQAGGIPGNAGIPDSALSSSSAFDGPSVGPQHARLHIDRSGGAWCPKQQIAENVKEYLQINLVNVTVISGIATQGRYGNGRGQEYAEQFRLEYWRPELALWRTYRHWGGNDILDGNSDTKTVVHHDISPPIIAKRLRIIPYGIYPRTVCMRVELYGCNWIENMASYSIPVGSSWSGSVTVEDLSYDGYKDHGTWTGGLGMLTDGEYGLNSFNGSTSTLKGQQGWVGWRNESIKQKPIEFMFNFDNIRNFSAVHIHANNEFTKGIQVFSKASLRFSIDGQKFSQKYINFYYMEDLAFEQARNVTIRIPHVYASYVKLQLWFAANWIMISEITFDSEVFEGQIEEESIFSHEITDHIDDELLIDGQDPPPESTILNTESIHIHGYFEAIVGALSAVMLLLITVIVIIILMSHRKKIMQENVVTFSAPYDVTTLKGKDGILGYAIEKSYSIPSMQYLQPKGEQNTGISGYSVNSEQTVTSGQNQQICAQFSSLRSNNIPVTQQNIAILNNHFPRIATDPISRRSCVKSFRTKAESASDIAGTGISWNIRPLADRLVVDNVSRSLNVPEVPRQCLRLVEWLGSSVHGEAYICHVVRAGEYENLRMQEPVVVRGGPIKETKNFLTEIKLLSSIDHVNICSLLAYSCSAGMGWMIFECPIYGDLNSYLKQLPTSISNKSVLDLATQVARAMEYLEEKGMVHKDLATRNCLLGPEMHLKVSDLAVISSAFKEDYGEVRGRKPLPLRWLPWETLVLDKFTKGSGIWMLAVTVWEIATSARERPYSGMNDTQVILNADHFFYSDGKQTTLPQPKNRPYQLFKWMMSCWSRDEAGRPTFKQSVIFLDKIEDSN